MQPKLSCIFFLLGCCVSFSKYTRMIYTIVSKTNHTFEHPGRDSSIDVLDIQIQST